MEQQIIDVTGLNPQQIAIVQEIVAAFRAVRKAKNDQEIVNHSIETTDPTTQELMQVIETSSSFSFLHDEPDLYTLEDGEPI